MRANYVGYLIATAVGIGMCATSVRAQDNRFAPSTPLPPVGAAGSDTQTLDSPARLVQSPSRVVPVSFCETCDTCNSGCDCQKFGCCGDCQDPSGFTFQWAPDKWAKVGAGIRTTFNSTTGVPGGPAASVIGPGGNFFNVNNARLFVSGQVGECIGFELNSEINNAQFLNNTLLSYPTTYNLLDAIIKYEFDDLFNIWAGQLLPPSDRAILDGPFFINGWDFPFVSNYPNVNQGREIGAVYWGQAGEGMLQWSVGAFNGTGRTLNVPSPDGIFNAAIAPGPPNPNGHPLQLAARVEVDLLNPEKGYYKQSTYYGKKGDLLNIGYAIQTQNNSVGTTATASNFTGMNVDGLYETVLDNCAVFTLEGAWYRYTDGGLVGDPAIPLTVAQAAQAGTSYFVFAGYLMPQIFGCCTCVEGRLRPWVRYQNYNHTDLVDSVGFFRQGVDVGCDYIINGHNARLTAFWGDRDVIGDGRIQIFRIGSQIVF